MTAFLTSEDMDDENEKIKKSIEKSFLKSLNRKKNSKKQKNNLDLHGVIFEKYDEYGNLIDGKNHDS